MIYTIYNTIYNIVCNIIYLRGDILGKMKDISKKKFGRLTAMEPTNQRKNGNVVWKCQCKCGNIVYVSRANLEQGFTSSCGCLQSENISQKNKLRQTKDIKNKRFGRLIALEPTQERSGGYIIWKCKCDCGNITYVSSHNLLNKNTLSCGCLNNELATKNAIKNISKHVKNNYIANTRLDFIKNNKLNKLNKNNTTGYTGVYLRKKDNKYTAHIEFQGKRYFLGSYETKEEAYTVRKEAENKLYGNFFEWYNSNYKK